MSKPVVPFGNKPRSPCFNLVLLSMFRLGQFNVLAAKVGISSFVLGRSAFLLPPEGFRCEREGIFVAASSLPQELRDPSRACGLCFPKKAITNSKKHIFNDAKWFTHTSTHKKLKLDFTKQLTANNMRYILVFSILFYF